MLLKINTPTQIDDIKINFDTELLWLLNIALAIIMFGVSLGITFNDFKRLLKQPKIVFIGIVSQFVLFPFLSFLLILILKPHPSFALGMLLVASCPGGNVSNFYSKMANGNTALSISLTAFATLVAVVTTPLNLSFWGSLYPPTHKILKEVSLNSFELFKLVALILALPLFLGMLVNYYNSKLAIKLNRLIKPFSILVFLILIGFALFNNIHVFKNYIHLVLFLVILHNFLGYTLGFWIAKAGKLTKKDTRTIAIETGIQNSGLGLLLVFSFFDGLGGLALILAFWGLWDMISGMLLAYHWSKS